MKKIQVKCWLFILLFLGNSFFDPMSVYAENTGENETTIDENDLYAHAAVLMDAVSGRILYGKNADEKMAMASTTKILTLIVTLEEANLEDTVTISKYAASMPDVQLSVREGEQYRLEDLLYSLMLESHNDSAVAIAEHVGGSIEKFAGLMNQKAEQIGCKNSFFITPNGLDATATVEKADGTKIEMFHSTTAADLAKILSYCITKSPKREQFLKITGTQSYSFGDLQGKRSFSCQNHNAFLSMMDGALTGKTGFTGKAGYCYTGALQQGDRIYVVALLACGWTDHKSYKWSDTKELMNYGISRYTMYNLEDETIDKNQIKKIPVLEGQTQHIGEKAYATVKIEPYSDQNSKYFLLRDNEKVEVTYQVKEHLNAPVCCGDVAGTITYLIDGEKWGTREITVTSYIKKIDYKWCTIQVIEKFLCAQ